MTLANSSIASVVKSWVNDTTNAFPVDFDLLWQGLGYSRKDNALRAFDISGMIENIDYVLLNNEGSVNHKGLSAQEKAAIARTRRYFLSVDAAKSFCMMANTEAGKIVRSYFLQCEAELKRVLAQVPVRSLSRQELMEVAFESLERERNLYHSNMPGLIALYEDAAVKKHLLAPAPKSAKEIVEDAGYTNVSLSAFGRYLTGLYVQLYNKEPEQKHEGGKLVNCYPAALWNTIETYTNRSN